jgi:hypothetical protein
MGRIHKGEGRTANPVLHDPVPLTLPISIFQLGSFLSENAADSSKMLVTTYHTTWCNQEDYSQKIFTTVKTSNLTTNHQSKFCSHGAQTEYQSYYSYIMSYKLPESNYLIISKE